jgi:hypothetical protein
MGAVALRSRPAGCSGMARGGVPTALLIWFNRLCDKKFNNPFGVG